MEKTYTWSAEIFDANGTTFTASGVVECELPMVVARALPGMFDELVKLNRQRPALQLECPFQVRSFTCALKPPSLH